MGAMLLAVLGLLDVSLGLLAVTAGIGWAAGYAARSVGGVRPAGVAVAAAVASVVLGLALRWAWSLVEGGALGPVAYLAERYGLLAVLLPVVAGVVAAVRAR
ncbi:MAG TPA: hypothetical protein VFK54_00300 [Candidatus Limnocylindrales bacterium]|nr:hypothetical protein [Candidatus Limnocylindrales bacterium]